MKSGLNSSFRMFDGKPYLFTRRFLAMSKINFCVGTKFHSWNYLGSAPALPTEQFLGSGQCAVGRSTALPCTAHRFQWAGCLGRSVVGSFWAVFVQF